MDEIDFSKIPIPDNWPEDAKNMVRFLIKRQERLEQEIRELHARLDQNSKNSNRPPSTDPPWKKRGRNHRPNGRKPGGQPGNPGKNRVMLPLEEVSHIETLSPEICGGCGHTLENRSLLLSTQRHQQVELPPVKAIVTEYRLQTFGCPCCGESTQASLPAEAGNRTMGPRLQSLLAYLTGRMHLSRRMAGELLEALLGTAGRFSLGCISECEEDMVEALSGPYEEALKWIRKVPVVHADETGWRMLGDSAWLWVAATETVSIFRIDESRGHQAFMALLQGFEGILVSDRWSAYRKIPIELRQLCWAHLTRDFQKLIDRDTGAKKLGEWAHSEIEVIFGLWHMFLEDEINKEDIVREFMSIKARFARLIKQGTNSSDVKARAFFKNLLRAWPALWTFLKHDGAVEPTNNRAERSLRSAVIWRKISFGAQSERGRLFVERMLTTVTTLRQQGRQVLDFLTYALTSFRSGMPHPSMLPVPSG